MPCMDPEPTQKERVASGEMNAHELEAFLCAIHRSQKVDLDVIDWRKVGISRLHAVRWWERHQELDRLREDREEREAEWKRQEELRQLAYLRNKYEL